MLGFLFSKYSEIEKYLLIQLFVPLKIFPTNFPICFRMYAFEKKIVSNVSLTACD